MSGEAALAYQQALTQKRIQFVQTLKEQLSGEQSVVSESVALYNELIEGKLSQG